MRRANREQLLAGRQMSKEAQLLSEFSNRAELPGSVTEAEQSYAKSNAGACLSQLHGGAKADPNGVNSSSVFTAQSTHLQGVHQARCKFTGSTPRAIH